MVNFFNDESGAVTVDWVVMTAAVVGLGLAVVAGVRSGVGGLGSGISTSLTGASVASLGTLGSTGSGLVPDEVPVSMPEPSPIAVPDPEPIILLGPAPMMPDF